MKIIITSITLIILLYVGIAEINAKDGIDIQQSNDIFSNTSNNVELKFMVVGDPHVKAYNDNDTGAERLRSIINFVNKMDIDFIVFMGDMTNKGTRKENNLVKDILKDLKKPYYVVEGNHDIMVSEEIFKEYYGDSEYIENIKTAKTVYQLLFIGTRSDRNESGNITNLYWSFDFSKADKDVPTIIFSHSPVRCPSNVYISCKLNEEKLIYAKSIAPELEKFTNLLGVYSGHIHRDSDDIVDEVRYVTINGLISIGIGDIFAEPSNYIGYSVIKDGKLYYKFIPYK